MLENAYGLGISWQGPFHGQSGGMPGFISNIYHGNEKKHGKNLNVKQKEK